MSQISHASFWGLRVSPNVSDTGRFSAMAKLKSKVGDSSQPDGADLYTFLTPLYYLAKATGLWPQTMKRSWPGFTIWSVLYQVGLYAFIGFCIYVNSDVALWSQYMKDIDSNILQYGLQIHVINGLAMAIIMSVVNLVQHRKKWRFLEMLSDTNEIFSKEFFVVIPYNTIKIVIYWVMFFEHVILITVILSYYYLLAHKLKIVTKLLYVSYYIINITTMVFTIDYISFVLSIRSRMILVNRCLKQLLFDKSDERFLESDMSTPTILYDEIFSIYGSAKKDSNQPGMRIGKDPSKQPPSKKSSLMRFLPNVFIYDKMIIKRPKIDRYSTSLEISQFIDKLSYVHYKVGESVIQLNRIYSLQLMLHFCAMFLFLVFGLFALYKAFNVSSTPFRLLATANGFWIVYYLVTIAGIISVTSSTVETNYASGDTVHQIIRNSQSTLGNDIVEKLSTFALQLKMRRVAFSCGLFHFDWPLFASILAAIAMYLVFLIQFDVSPTQANVSKET
ncbi:gustatory receptor for bitter taste 66a-like [Sabethes cyaneus]|uniref:gustatory receptor for bitter taste 66a-like n=1 Tax=Sabethes cyaneus TaxID=53552 RepID=UPI00237E8B6A|nr:gustatory receptor for bitter taste 66a-like [Sabethes cyaneus]